MITEQLSETPLLTVRNLSKVFGGQNSWPLGKRSPRVRAVDNVSFTIKRGETLGLVGESGSGKTTTSRLLMRLLDATDGEVIFNERNVFDLSDDGIKDFRRNVQIVFQDPFSSLDPRMTAEKIVSEPLITCTSLTKAQRKARVAELLTLVGLPPEYADRLPHQFSGGQRQRIGIARALALNPQFLICDEPVSALDLSVQAQIINLLQDLQRDLGLTMLFVAHDLHVVRHISDRVGVMYLGRLVEIGDTDQLFDRPRHPYTELLLRSSPSFIENTATSNADDLQDVEMPSPLDPPKGCHFHPRCPLATDICRSEVPKWRKIEEDRRVLCHHA